MNQFFLTLGGLTLGGSIAVVLLALAGRSGRYGARWRCWAWVLLCLRLAVPLSLLPHVEDRAPIQVDLPAPPVVTQPPVVSPSPGDGSVSTPPGTQNGPAVPGVQTPPSTPSPTPSEGSRSLSISLALLGIWLLGAAALLGWSTLSHLRFLSYLRRWSSPVTDGEAIAAFNQLGDQLGLNKRPRLLVCQGLKVPMLVGLFHPAILLPPGELSGQELGFSLLHELTHYRRRDIWLKTLAMWVNTLHWFNPLAWYMVRLVERDTELACDEEALRRLPPDAYAAYGQTILAAVAKLQNKERNTP